MKRKIMFLALAAIGLASCNGGFKNADGGLQYKIVAGKGAPTLKEGDFVSVNVVAKTDADSVLFSTYELGHPSFLVISKPQGKGDVLSALKYLAESDSAVIKTNIDSNLAKGAPRPPFKGKYVSYFIKIEKVIAKGNLSDQIFRGRIDAYVKTETDLIRSQEPAKIKKYVAEKNLKLTTTASGLQYVINKEGVGEKVANGDTVAVFYTGRFLNGKIFDSNVKADLQKAKMPINPMAAYKPIKFAVGLQGMIKGWNEAMPLLSKGAKATFILPSNLGYGDQGYQQVPGFTPLVFDVELVDIIHPNPNAPKPTSIQMLAQPNHK